MWDWAWYGNKEGGVLRVDTCACVRASSVSDRFEIE